MNEENEAELKLDYSIESPKLRTLLVEKIVNSLPPEKLTPSFLEILSKYILFAMTKEERKEKKILTDNRMKTVNLRETSYQGLCDRFEAGEDAVQPLIANDKDIIFMPKISITKKDIEEVPGLRELRESIAEIEEQEKKATGRRRFQLRKQLIQMRQDQYVLKAAARKPIRFTNIVRGISKLSLDEHITYDPETEEVKSDCFISFYDPAQVKILLDHYSKLKQESYGKINSDAYYFIMDFDNLIEKALADQPIYRLILSCKIDELKNKEIQEKILEEFNVTYNANKISNVWRQQIPKLIAEEAKREFIDWHFLQEERGTYKKCNKCGEVKLVNHLNFSPNGKNKWYSICKECRRRK